MTFDEKINVLTTAFAAEIVRALRGVPVQELFALSGKRVTTAAAPARGARVANAGGRPTPAKRGAYRTRATDVAVPLDPRARAAALDFFMERGAKGATGVQVEEHLRVSGFGNATSEVVGELAARGAIRDAGIRRATGKGTAPVYVDATLAVRT